ncbi:hypothetical protein ABIF68_003679 [Bradyrhizobium japonicum]|jgi:hypothetical protein
MAKPPPNTEEEASQHCTFVPNITDMHIEKYGKEITRVPRCAELGPHRLCESYMSSDGKTVFAIYCDEGGNCLRRYECPA